MKQPKELDDTFVRHEQEQMEKTEREYAPKEVPHNKNEQKNIAEFYQSEDNSIPVRPMIDFGHKGELQANATRVLGKSNSMLDLQGNSVAPIFI